MPDNVPSHNPKLRRIGGFTLAELLIVVAIVGVLVAIAIPVFTARLAKAQEATCIANRRSMYAEVVTTAMDTEKEAEVFGKIDRLAKGYTCPNGGNWSWDTGTRSITCDEHPDETENPSITTSKSYLSDWNKFIDSITDPKIKNNNSKMRELFFAEYGSPLLTYQGKDYNVQPFFKSTGETWLFAREGTGDNWSANFVYDPIDQSWYRCVKENGSPTSASISSISTTEELHKYMMGELTDQWNNRWEKVENPKISSVT